MINKKIVVFDLDETLGYFVEFGMFWDAITSFLHDQKVNVTLDQNDFNNILDLYPEFIRPKIISILKYIKNKINTNECEKIIIYTNNQGPIEWAHYIKNYFEKKINYKLFDKIIAAFKVNGKRVEICRTTHNKSHQDFIKCTKINKNAQICFLDDTYYPKMQNENVYYINVKPYMHDLSFEEMINRYINNVISKKYVNDHNYFIIYMKTFLKRYHFNHIDKNAHDLLIDKIVSKKMANHLHIFFSLKQPNYICTNKTRSNKNNYNNNKCHNKTLKKMNKNI